MTLARKKAFEKILSPVESRSRTRMLGGRSRRRARRAVPTLSPRVAVDRVRRRWHPCRQPGGIAMAKRCSTYAVLAGFLLVGTAGVSQAAASMDELEKSTAEKAFAARRKLSSALPSQFLLVACMDAISFVPGQR